MVTCPLCGFSFGREMGTSACPNCPLHGDCPWICCPNCGYSLPPDKGAKSGSIPVRSLADLKSGEAGEIESTVPGTGEEQLRILASMGLLPGHKVMMVRRFPSILVRVGNRNLALDRRLATALLLRNLP